VDPTYVIAISASILGGFGLTTFFAKRMVAGFTQDIKDIKTDGRLIRDDIHAIRLQLAEKYMEKTEVKELITEVKKDFLEMIKVFLRIESGPSQDSY